ncbi:primosomal protein N' [Indioceanicola profundi]|uniref:primosomal protein N' n=1 Tax=Indioceanicola profundi TaxID=2220096 RepID=UPI0038508F65
MTAEEPEAPKLGRASSPKSKPPPPAGPARRVAVALPLPFPEPFDYRVPDGLDLAPGDYVEVPLGPRRVFGVVWGAPAQPAEPAENAVPDAKLKPVARRFDLPPMPEASRRFIEWVAGYTMSQLGNVLRMAVSVSAALEEPRAMTGYCRADADLPDGFKLTAARKAVLALMADGPPRTAADIANEAGCSPAVVRAMADAGVLLPVPIRPLGRFQAPDGTLAGPTLSDFQREAADHLAARVTEGGYSCTLLDGVTGSGKTEVYFEAVAAALRAGKQALVLLPEIALSAQWLDRFQARFGARPAEWHSDLTGMIRRTTWRAIASGEARVVVGARSALFLPYPDLGLIVVDEEHEPAFKQEDGVIYHARDMAVARAHLGKIPTVLVSATPALETLVNAEVGRYTRMDLPGRHGGATMPDVTLIDLRKPDAAPPRHQWLSPILRKAMTETLEAGEQGMLFLNRRGYAPLTLCRACGHRLQCPNCTAWLVEHRLTKRLQCHHCGFTAKTPESCENCGAEESFVACGPGVERVAEEAAMLWPEARVAMMTSDTLLGPRAIQDVIDKVKAQEIDLLIGTQVMAKGHHFPMLTLVGVVDADLGLSGGDLRASERTFQLLHQVAGRAGRESRPGRVYLQTHMPEHPVMQALASHDREAFLDHEKQSRLETGMPPFGRLAALIVSGEDDRLVDQVALRLGRTAPRDRQELLVLGPAPAPLSILRGRHRRRLLIQGPKGLALQPIVAEWLDKVEIPPQVRVQVDIDPYSFM